MNSLRVICVHSLTSYGVVGLKAFLPVLGELCLPVPSMVLSGPGDMTGCERFPCDTIGLLRSVLRAAVRQQDRLVLFVGYVASPQQIAAIAELIDEYRQHLFSVCIDPVCGDDGRAYVAAEIVSAWPSLLKRADWLFPNVTEAELLTGKQGEASVAALRNAYPSAGVIVTGQVVGSEIETRFHAGNLASSHRQPHLGGRFNGAGDLFSAYFVRAVFVEGAPAPLAISSAAEGVSRSIQLSLARGETALSVRAIL